jgi:subtilisin family serine protease
MCDHVAGELLFGFHRDDSAAALLIEWINGGEISHVKVLESLETKLEKLGLNPRRDLTFRFLKLGVPHGQEAFKIGFLHFWYKHALRIESSYGRFNPETNPVHREIENRSDFHPQIAQNGLLSTAGPTASPKPGTRFTFDATHTTYKAQVGWPGGTLDGAGRRILVVDTGVDSAASYNVVDGRNFLDDRQKLDVSDEHGHGTAMTSIIHDVAPGAEVVVYKAGDGKGIASEWSLLAALQADSGAHIVNVSLQFGMGELMCRSCGRASHSTRSGLFENMLGQLKASPDAPVLVAAAGNAGLTELSYPARYDSVVAVESVDSAGALARFSNRSTTNHENNLHQHVFVMPGGRGHPGLALSEYVGRSAGGALQGGTSAAAAYASGLIARIWSTPPHTASTRTGILTYLALQASRNLPDYLQATHGNGLMQCR